MDLGGKRILVIGGAGLIGSHLVDLLVQERCAEIVVYDNFSRGHRESLSSALRDPRVRVFDVGGDICQPDILRAAMRGMDGVFHLAALWLLQCHDYPRAAFDVNVAGTFNVLEACVAEGVKRLVYSSSASVYGDAVSEPMSEDHPFNNQNFYGATKICGEAMLRAFHHRYGLDYVGLRYMNVYGPRQEYRGPYAAVVMQMLNRLVKGESPVVYGDGSQAYDFVHVRDCAAANVAAMSAVATDRFYNVGSGKKTSIRTLAEQLIARSGKPVQIAWNPAGRSFVRSRVADITAAERDLGFRARVPLDDGLEEVIAWRFQEECRA